MTCALKFHRSLRITFLTCFASMCLMVFPVLAGKPAAPSINPDDAIIIEGSSKVLIPVRENDAPSGLMKISSGYRGGSVFYSGAAYVKSEACQGCLNVVVHDQSTGETRLLLEKNARIVVIYVPSDHGSGDKFLSLLFGIVDVDTNTDGQLNAEDSVVLYVSDLAVSKLTPVTPAGGKFLSWSADRATGNLFVRVQHDSDNDRRFTDKDRVTMYKVNTKSPSMGKLLIDEEMEKVLKTF